MFVLFLQFCNCIAKISVDSLYFNIYIYLYNIYHNNVFHRVCRNWLWIICTRVQGFAFSLHYIGLLSLVLFLKLMWCLFEKNTTEHTMIYLYCTVNIEAKYISQGGTGQLDISIYLYIYNIYTNASYNVIVCAKYTQHCYVFMKYLYCVGHNEIQLQGKRNVPNIYNIHLLCHGMNTILSCMQNDIEDYRKKNAIQ